MATVYRHAQAKGIPSRNRKLEKFIALNSDVQDELKRVTEAAAFKARAILAAHRDEGHAEILVEHGRVDYYLILSDMRGLKAAMSIEYGRQADENGRGGMAGLYILHRAMNLKRKGR